MRNARLTQFAFGSLAFAICCLATFSAQALDPAKVVIIKADDFRGPSQAWTNFLQVSRQAGVKVGIGVIVTSIAGKSSTAAWMQSQQAMGDVEFWDHGWDHTQWTTNGQTVSEFKGSGLDYMRQHLADAQAGLSNALGHDVLSLGTPYNGFDADTATVINETPALRLFYSSASAASSLLNPRVKVVRIISESDGTGMPNAAKFQVTFPPGSKGPISLQFHPPYFDAAHLVEYQKILQYLQTNGYSILLPSEYATPAPQVFIRSDASALSVTISGSGAAGDIYRILAANDITLPLGDWSTLSSGTFGTGVFEFVDTEITNHSQRFYRVATP